MSSSKQKTGCNELQIRKRPLENQDSLPANKRKSVDSRNSESDKFCWICHSEETSLQCVNCPRSFHKNCLNIPKIINYQCEMCRKEMFINRHIDNIALSKALNFVLQNLEMDNKDFKALRNIEFNSMPSNSIINPIDFETIIKKNKKEKYVSTQSFLTDVLWIEHDLSILNPVSGMLANFQTLKNKVIDFKTVIDGCLTCFLQTFTEVVCERPHLLAWSKVKGYQPWPAKIVALNNTFAFCIFFGSNDYCKVSVKETFLLTKDYPGKTSISKKVKNAVNSMSSYLEGFETTYGPFKYSDLGKQPTKEHLKYYEDLKPLSMTSNDLCVREQANKTMHEIFFEEENFSSESNSDTDLDEDSYFDIKLQRKRKILEASTTKVDKIPQMKRSKPKPLCKLKKEALCKLKKEALLNRFEIKLNRLRLNDDDDPSKGVANKTACKKDNISSEQSSSYLVEYMLPDSNIGDTIPIIDLTDDNIPCLSPTIKPTQPSSSRINPYSLPAFDIDNSPNRQESDSSPIVYANNPPGLDIHTASQNSPIEPSPSTSTNIQNTILKDFNRLIEQKVMDKEILEIFGTNQSFKRESNFHTTSSHQQNEGQSQDRLTPSEQPRVQLSPAFSNNNSENDGDPSDVSSVDGFTILDYSKYLTTNSDSFKTVQEVKDANEKVMQNMIQESQEYQYKLLTRLIRMKNKHVHDIFQLKHDTDKQSQLIIDELNGHARKLQEDHTKLIQNYKKLAAENEKLKKEAEDTQKEMVAKFMLECPDCQTCQKRKDLCAPKE